MHDTASTSAPTGTSDPLELLTVKEAIGILRVSKTSLYRLVRERQIEYTRVAGVILFTREQLRDFLRRNAVSAVTSDTD